MQLPLSPTSTIGLSMHVSVNLCIYLCLCDASRAQRKSLWSENISPNDHSYNHDYCLMVSVKSHVQRIQFCKYIYENCFSFILNFEFQRELLPQKGRTRQSVNIFMCSVCTALQDKVQPEKSLSFNQLLANEPWWETADTPANCGRWQLSSSLPFYTWKLAVCFSIWLVLVTRTQILITHFL